MISIIIPVLNEEAVLAKLLDSLCSLPNKLEIIVVDGNSEDNSVAIAEQFDCKILTCDRRQRAAQLNLGAEEASGDTLLFLHADTPLQAEHIDSIEVAIQNGIEGGAFYRRFDNPSIILKITCLIADLKTRYLKYYYGDQAMFIKKSVFTEIGGFSDMNICEDLDLAIRMKKHTKVKAIKPQILSSARRFENKGALLQSLIDTWIAIRFISTPKTNNRH